MSMCGILVEPEHVSDSMAYNSLAFSLSVFFGPVIGGILV